MIKKQISTILRKGKAGKELIENSRELYRFIQYCRNNEFLYYALLLIDERGGLDKGLSILRNKEESLSRNMGSAIGEISRSFKEKGLKFFPMKTFRKYPYTDDDIDIVMADRRRAREYAATLKEIGYKFMPDRSILREPGKRFYVKKNSDHTIELPKIHLHFDITWNGIKFLDAKKVFKRSKSVSISGVDLQVPSDEDELLIMAAHAIYENSYITTGELLHAKEIFANNREIDIEYMLKASNDHNWDLGLRCYFSYAELYHRYFTGIGLLNDLFREKLYIPYIGEIISARESLPYLIPLFSLLGVYSRKVSEDVRSLNLLEIPREVLSFGLVTWLLRFRKGTKFKKEVRVS